MGGQVLGGGVIVLVAVLLWMVYLLPTWHSRRQYDAAERNAVRLNQALRVLAETSETPQEVRLELNARTAMAQQKLARRAQAEREQTALESARTDLELARDERAAARDRPIARRARARRRTRLTLTATLVVALALAGWGVWQVVLGGAQIMLIAGIAAAGISALLLQRMSKVGARSAVRASAPAIVVRSEADMQDVALVEAVREGWAPRELPRPLTASAGSRAAAVLDAAAAREALRRAALEESMRQRAAELQPASIETARVARAESSPYAAASEYDAMGRVDDAEIEAHVRRLLAQRAAG